MARSDSGEGIAVDHGPAGGGNAAHFDSRADDVFARIAARYDLLCDLFSLGLHRMWKRRVAELIAVEPWERMLDGASGTGDIALMLAKRYPQRVAAGSIIVSDINAPMLAIARQRAAPLNARLRFQTLDAHSLAELPADSIDLYSISLALKICDRRRVFSEALRVLRPGGIFISLEASAISNAWLQSLYIVYVRLCMPLLGWIATRDASAYLYLLRGIESFPDAEALSAEMRASGFENVVFERLSLGVVAIHLARKPGGAMPLT